MTQQKKVTMTPAQLMLRVVGVAFASVVLFALLAVLGGASGTAEAADRPAGLGDLLGGDRPISNVLAPIVAPVADVVTPILQPSTPAAPTPGPPRQRARAAEPHPSPRTDHRTRRHTGRRHRSPRRRHRGHVVTPSTDTVGHVVHPVVDTVAPVVEPVVPVTEIVAPVAEIVVPVVDPAFPAAPSSHPAAPSSHPAAPSSHPSPTASSPGVNPVVPPTGDTPHPPASDPVVPDGEPAASDETTTVPDLTEEPVVAPVVDEVTIQTAVAAAPGVRSAGSSVVTSAVPAALSDAVRHTTDVGASPETSNGRTTSGPTSAPFGPFPAGSNAPGFLPSIVSGLLSGANSSPSPGGAPVAMLAVLTATAAAMFMLSRRVTATVSWRSALVLSSVERPG